MKDEGVRIKSVKRQERAYSGVTQGEVLEHFLSIRHELTDDTEIMNRLLELLGSYYDAKDVSVYESRGKKDEMVNTWRWNYYGHTDPNLTINPQKLSSITGKNSKMVYRSKGITMYDLSDSNDRDSEAYGQFKQMKIRGIMIAGIGPNGLNGGFLCVSGARVNPDDVVVIQTAAALIFNELTKIKEIETQKELSFRDSLTRCFNRRAFSKRISTLNGKKIPIGILFVDADGLKALNDFEGHSAGDRRLKMIANMLRQTFGDAVYRISGDEFVVLAEEIEEADFSQKSEKIKSQCYKKGIATIGSDWVNSCRDIRNSINYAERMMENDRVLKYRTAKLSSLRADKSGIETTEDTLQDSNRKPVVLVADGDEVHREVLRQMLKEDYEIHQVTRVSEALDYMKENSAVLDIVLLNTDLPMGGGFEVLAYMNKYQWISNISVILIKESKDTDMKRLYELGAEDYIQYPFDRAQIKHSLENATLRFTSTDVVPKAVYKGKTYYEPSNESQNSLAAIKLFCFRFYPEEGLMVATDSMVREYRCDKFYDRFPEDFAERYITEEDRPILRNMVLAIRNGEEKVSSVVRTVGYERSLRISLIAYQRNAKGKTVSCAGLVENAETNLMITELMQSLSMDYQNVYYVSLVNNKVYPFMMGEEINRNYGQYFNSNPTLEQASRAYSQCVLEADREAFLVAASKENILKELKHKNIFMFDYRRILDGKTRYYRMKVVKMNTTGDVFNISMGFADITDTRDKELAAQNALAKALAEANAANKAKSLFLNNMSHDIRTPMNAIMGYTHLAKSHIEEEARLRDYLDKIQLSGDHLLSLINDCLDMSRIESGHTELESNKESLSEIVAEIESLVRPQTEEKGQFFNLDISDIKHDEIHCDKLRLKQVILNCLSNSIKFTDAEGSISLTVKEDRRRSKKDNKSGGRYSCYIFKIRDSGRGMSKDFLEHVFEPFARETSSTISGIQGTGLGMSICKSLVELMDGDIKVESELGRGTEITISVVFYIDELSLKNREDFDDEERASLESAENNLVSSRMFEGMRVLLAEDNTLNAEIACEILGDDGIETEVAANGAEAVEMLRKHGPGYYNCVFMDVQMPLMNGYEATRHIRGMKNGVSGIPIYAMTANAFEQDKKNSLEAGMNGHIAKPISIDNLHQVLCEVLGDRNG